MTPQARVKEPGAGPSRQRLLIPSKLKGWHLATDSKQHNRIRSQFWEAESHKSRCGWRCAPFGDSENDSQVSPSFWKWDQVYFKTLFVWVQVCNAAWIHSVERWRMYTARLNSFITIFPLFLSPSHLQKKKKISLPVFYYLSSVLDFSYQRNHVIFKQVCLVYFLSLHHLEVHPFPTSGSSLFFFIAV